MKGKTSFADTFREKPEDKKEPANQKDPKPFDQKVITKQQRVNQLREKVLSNEKTMIALFLLVGTGFDWAVSSCTGDFDIKWYTYFGYIVAALFFGLLMIAGSGLPSLVIAKYVLALVVGGVAMQIIIAWDWGHWQFLTYRQCRYPMSVDIIIGWIVGIATCFMIINSKKD